METHSRRLLLTNSYTGAKAPEDHPRAAPARPKPLDFPHYQARGDSDVAHEYTQDFNRLFVSLEKNVSTEHLQAFELSPHGEIPLDRLIPDECLPPSEWLQDPSLATQASDAKTNPAKLSNGIPCPGRKEFYDRAKELLYDTDAAFGVISGKGIKGTRPVRLAYSHKFYQHLLLMAEYWDTSKDHYTQEGDKLMYTGRRYGASHEMPPQFREDTVCAFVEMCIWPFRCNIQNPQASVTRKLRFQDRYLPIQGVTSAVCRNTTDRQKAKRGIMEGPLMGIHCRNITTFRAEGQALGQGKEELLDLLFEVGAALLVAQKRAREGKEEVQPGKDRFWGNRSTRHLGEVGGGKQDKETNARARREIASEDGDPMEGVEVEGGGADEKSNETGGNEKTSETGGNGSKKRKQRPGATQAYLDAKPPESMWEGKVEYRMIGKDVGAGADNVRFPPFQRTHPINRHTHTY